ncbi:BAG family molecular chaperone regulator 2-like isoform X2 [Pararge aegeria]|uniref:BAG family molecular chaperone regulator 2-like isoform X2 n=1 Tax=Pararge aegeria TaxID=116150 RepID=UPI0019CF9A2B|nr:BAG family molecular chaperone regulator 2-like isoform X2 [Pararge aegeria]
MIKLTSLLDQTELRVERLRQDALRIEGERRSLLSTLDSVKHSELPAEVSECDKDDLLRYAHRLLARATTVQVEVRTERNAKQEDAYNQANVLVDQLMASVHNNAGMARLRWQGYMNACTSQPNSGTGIDGNFETVVLGCTLDDQKRIKKRLQGIDDILRKLY